MSRDEQLKWAAGLTCHWCAEGSPLAEFPQKGQFTHKVKTPFGLDYVPCTSRAEEIVQRQEELVGAAYADSANHWPERYKEATGDLVRCSCGWKSTSLKRDWREEEPELHHGTIEWQEHIRRLTDDAAQAHERAVERARLEEAEWWFRHSDFAAVPKRLEQLRALDAGNADSGKEG